MRAVRVLLGTILLLAIIAGAVYAFRLPLAGMAVRSAMASAGFGNPQAQVTALSFERVALRNVSVGSNGEKAFDLEVVEAEFDWRRLLNERAVDIIRIGPGVVRVVVSRDGEVTAPGVPAEGGGGGNAELHLPFSTLSVSGVALIAATPEGAAHGNMTVDYNKGAGGTAHIRLDTDSAGLEAGRIENGLLAVDVTLDEKDALSIAATVKGDVLSPIGAVRDIDIALEAALRSWRDIANNGLQGASGDLLVTLASAAVRFEDMPSTSIMNSEQSAMLFGGPVSSMRLAGELSVHASDGEIIASLGGRPVTIGADNGARLSISELLGAQLYRRAGDQQAASFSFDISGAGISANGTVNAEKAESDWFVLAPIRIGDYRSDNISFDDASAIVRLNTHSNGVRADITTTTTLRALSVGRMSVFDAPLEANFLIETDNSAKTATVTLPAEGCLSLQDARITIDQQDTEATLKNAQLCESGDPLGVVDWSGDLQAWFDGLLNAERINYRLGQTTIVGRSPDIAFSGLYQPDLNLTTVKGDVVGGRLVLNDMLVFTQAEGDFDFELNQQMMSASSRLNTARIAQNMRNAMVAPVLAAGELRLQDKDVDFEYVLTTPVGQRLGAGVGVHNVATTRGQSTFLFDRIEYVADGVQPNILAPVLKGIIGQTTGVTNGEAVFTWAPSELSSSATFVLEDITFSGPTRVVTQTIGVNGQLNFASLWPVETDGVQTITVSGVDFGALQIDQTGQIRFDMPGDETLRIEKAEFPWFGGQLGVYDATASLSGGEAVAPLRAENIDLALILDYVDMDGLSGEGILSGVLPLIVKDGKAAIENGVLHSDSPGAIRYQGQASEAAAATGEQAQIAFDLLRDLQFSDLVVAVDGPLDGRLQFQLKFEGTGEVALNSINGRVPVIYRINLDAALLELLNQATLSQSIQLQIQQGLQEAQQ